MTGSVLVAYATKYGAIAGIAEKIGQVLVEAGIDAEVLPAEDVSSGPGWAEVAPEKQGARST